jgi:hypothetical protein
MSLTNLHTAVRAQVTSNAQQSIDDTSSSELSKIERRALRAMQRQMQAALIGNKPELPAGPAGIWF